MDLRAARAPAHPEDRAERRRAARVAVPVAPAVVVAAAAAHIRLPRGPRS